MNSLRHFFAVGLSLFLVLNVSLAAETVSLARQDQMSVPVTAYLPRDGNCRGIAIISPGAGGSEKGYVYLAEAMSSGGYLAVVVGHQESGPQGLREYVRDKGIRDGLARLVTESSAYRGRFMDIAAARHWARSRCDARESVLIGHSMGAATAMIEAGARNNVGVEGADSFDVYVALSPQGVGAIFPRDAWANIHRPVLTLTGKRDHALAGSSWETRTEPFKSMPAGCKWLGVIDEATHMNFAGHGMSRDTERMTVKTVGAFLDQVRRHDCDSPPREQGIEIRSK